MKQLLHLFLILTLFAGCSKGHGSDSPDPGSGKTSSSKKGFAESEERPEGKQFVLPEGVSIINGKFKGYAPGYEQFCGNKTIEEALGHGMGVRLCIGLHNNTTQIIHVSFPSGMIFISRSLNVQHGLLVQGETVELPPGQDFYVPLLSYCLNASRSGAFPEDDYDLGPVTNDVDMLELLSLLSKKKLPKFDTEKGDIQKAVWHACDGHIDDQDKADIAALPDR